METDNKSGKLLCRGTKTGDGDLHTCRQMPPPGGIRRGRAAKKQGGERGSICQQLPFSDKGSFQQGEVAAVEQGVVLCFQQHQQVIDQGGKDRQFQFFYPEILLSFYSGMDRFILQDLGCNAII